MYNKITNTVLAKVGYTNIPASWGFLRYVYVSLNIDCEPQP